eukprot:6638378-Prymnesium_polylepis.1
MHKCARLSARVLPPPPGLPGPMMALHSRRRSIYTPGVSPLFVLQPARATCPLSRPTSRHPRAHRAPPTAALAAQ